MRAAADRYELHYQDETHLETNPHLTRVWHRVGVQATVPAAGTNRRLTCFGSVEAFGRGRVEVLCAAQDSAAFIRYLDALELRHLATGRKIILVLDNGPCHTSKVSRAALAARATGSCRCPSVCLGRPVRNRCRASSARIQPGAMRTPVVSAR